MTRRGLEIVPPTPVPQRPMRWVLGFSIRFLIRARKPIDSIWACPVQGQEACALDGRRDPRIKRNPFAMGRHRPVAAADRRHSVPADRRRPEHDPVLDGEDVEHGRFRTASCDSDAGGSAWLESARWQTVRALTAIVGRSRSIRAIGTSRWIAGGRACRRHGRADEKSYMHRPLSKGDRVRVRRRVEGGWAAIDPPATTIGWVERTSLDLGDGAGERRSHRLDPARPGPGRRLARVVAPRVVRSGRLDARLPGPPWIELRRGRWSISSTGRR